MKIRTDHITNSSSSSFICRKCGEEINGYDWDEDYERKMCNYCYSTLSEAEKEKVDKGEYTSDSDINVLDFIDFLCNEIPLDKDRIIEVYNEWKEEKF